jgi:hypothetical protein
VTLRILAFLWPSQSALSDGQRWERGDIDYGRSYIYSMEGRRSVSEAGRPTQAGVAVQASRAVSATRKDDEPTALSAVAAG